jgi:uncharacterized protein (TIGR00290 family)
MPEPVIVGWSGGKDSTVALERLLDDPAYEVAGLLTTVSAEFDRVSIHGVRRVLLAEQAAGLDLPLVEAVLPSNPTNAVYEQAFALALEEWRARIPGLRTVAFGDLFLADIRAYRERQLGELGMRAVFPVWGEPTAPLARSVVSRGYRPIVVCLDRTKLAASFAGAAYDDGFLDNLPTGIDPCGEQGEFHTFVTDGPIFRRPVAVTRGEVVTRDGSVFADLLPAA